MMKYRVEVFGMMSSSELAAVLNEGAEQGWRTVAVWQIDSPAVRWWLIQEAKVH